MSYQLPAFTAVIEQRLPLLPEDSTIVQQVAVAVRRIHREAVMLTELKPDADRSEAFNATVKNAEAARLRDRIAKSRGELNLLTANFRAEQQRARMAKANLTEGALAQELRTVFRGLDAESKINFLAEAIKAGDAATVASIVKAPPILVGLSAQQQAHWEQAFLEKYSPSDTRDIDELQQIINTSLDLAESIATPTVAPTRSTV